MVDFGKMKTTAEDRKVLALIVKRASNLLPRHDRLSLTMDLEAVHNCGCPMDFSALLLADDGNFAHDVCGIMRHIDRDTGKLGDCFLPRFAKVCQHA